MVILSVLLALAGNIDFVHYGSDAQPGQSAASEHADTEIIVPKTEWPNILDATKTALQSVKTAQGTFVQSNADGSILTGRFALALPGRIRFDYDDPSPVLIVSDGTTVAMQDRALETIDRVPLDATPFGLILDRDLSNDETVDILGINQNSNRIGIHLQDATGELDGSVTLIFTRADYTLLGWEAIDGYAETTRVNLLDIKVNTRLDPRLFRLDEDEDEDDPR